MEFEETIDTHHSHNDSVSEALTIESVATSEVPTVAPHNDLRIAIALISHGEVGSVVAVEDGVPVGIMTERDIVKLIPKDLMSYHVRDVMSNPVITIDLEEHPANALMILIERNIRHLPIVRGEKLVGILTDRELLRWIIESPKVC